MVALCGGVASWTAEQQLASSSWEGERGPVSRRLLLLLLLLSWVTFSRLFVVRSLPLVANVGTESLVEVRLELELVARLEIGMHGLETNGCGLVAV